MASEVEEAEAPFVRRVAGMLGAVTMYRVCSEVDLLWCTLMMGKLGNSWTSEENTSWKLMQRTS